MAGKYRPRLPESLACTHCGRLYESRHQRTRYCSGDCRTQAFNRRAALRARVAKSVDQPLIDPQQEDLLTIHSEVGPPPNQPLTTMQTAQATMLGMGSYKILETLFFSAGSDRHAALSELNFKLLEQIRAGLATDPIKHQAMVNVYRHQQQALKALKAQANQPANSKGKGVDSLAEMVKKRKLNS